MRRKMQVNCLPLLVLTVLFAAMSLMMTGCGTQPPGEGERPLFQSGSVLGDGGTEFAFTVVDIEGEEQTFTIRTDRELVGEALQDVGMIAGEEGEFGLYVKTVNGITLDYDTHGKYWAFYENGSYAVAGADQTAIDPGVVYSFRAE